MGMVVQTHIALVAFGTDTGPEAPSKFLHSSRYATVFLIDLSRGIHGTVQKACINFIKRVAGKDARRLLQRRDD